MTARFLLDTNICIYTIKQTPLAVIERLRQHASDTLAVSSITAAELYFGVAKSGSARNRLALSQFLSSLQILPFDQAAADVYGNVRAHLERSGTPIGPLDTQIAAHALALGFTMVTNNTREFERVPGLKVENWAVPNNTGA
ncbi:MAG: type II toxin-antitoxin system VapC family toxin [Aquabacterium sp.]|uniref:type II toxin-antitoxin system tRNA(fMet)-specific endonuclease VapC n=1 Tax=Aquabacterium sp. TaxID=1872578 RepID=UPI002727DCE7|nr:type II toxin-antitoxin system VapC family toxin [Aquabacterium sp.]MDO9002186.1 type II toxin-antitoxin system VapC family toxin [Aquabacterium sp.]